MTIRTLIVDDEPLARRGVRQHLSMESDIEVIGECGDGAAAIAAIAELRPDLVFFDIAMPEVDGFDVVEAVGVDRMPAVIFVTAFDQYAVRAFDIHAVDYLLKPIDEKRIERALARARERLFRKPDDLAARIAAALGELGRAVPRRYVRRLAVKKEGRLILVDVSEIDRVESAGNYVEVHAGDKVHLLRETLTNLEERLDPENFVRVSRSLIVNTNSIRELQAMFNGDFVVVLNSGAQVSGSRRYRDRLERLFG